MARIPHEANGWRVVQFIGHDKPRRRWRDMIRRPTWGVLILTYVLFAMSVLLINWDVTRNNVGWVLA